MSARTPVYCPGYYFTPLLSAIKVFGIDILLPCSCTEQLTNYRRRRFFSSHYKKYLFIIEVFLWLMTIFSIVQIFMPDFYCVRVISLYNNYALPASFALLVISVYGALQFSIIKRKKLNLHFMKSSYREESTLADKLEPYTLKFFVLFFFILLMISLMPTLIFYSVIKKQNGTDSEAFICSFINTLWLFYMAAHIASIISIFCIISITVSIRLKKLSEELIKIKIGTDMLIQKLNDVIEKHTELWEFCQIVNKDWTYLISLIYVHYLYATCFFTFGALFGANINPGLRLIIGITSLVLLTGIILLSWLTSYSTSLIYDDFVSIGKFYSSYLSPEFKLKVIDFMKRFRGLPMGISFAGFFFAKKNFVIKVANSLYSIFSSMVELGGVMQKNKTCTSIFSTNSSSDIIY